MAPPLAVAWLRLLLAFLISPASCGQNGYVGSFKNKAVVAGTSTSLLDASDTEIAVSYTHLRAHETLMNL
eukprot:6874569-Prymnesium_polylepis.1